MIFQFLSAIFRKTAQNIVGCGDHIAGVILPILLASEPSEEYLFVEQHQGVPAPRKVKIHEDLHSVNAPPVQDQIRFQFQTTLPS